MSQKSKNDLVLKLAHEFGIVRPRDLASYGIQPVYLRRLCEQGLLLQTTRGLYQSREHSVTAHHSLATISKRIPNGVICLLSALQFHELTTQSSPDVWIAIDRKARRPTMNNLPIRLVRFSGVGLQQGIDQQSIEGVPIRITNVSRTVVDCFKYRNKIGVDLALEALRDALHQKKTNIKTLANYAQLFRLSNVIQPYLEALA